MENVLSYTQLYPAYPILDDDEIVFYNHFS